MINFIQRGGANDCAISKKRGEEEIMDIHDYVELIALAFWVISVVSVGIFNMYDQENLSDEKKINRVGNAVVDGLQAKGFKLNEQEVQDIFAEVAKQMNDLHETQDK